MKGSDILTGRILIIDDTKNIRLLTTKALTSEGYEVDSVDNGQQGVELFCRSKYDLVLVDIRMPYLSGTEVLKQIKDIDKSIPVVIITAYPTVKNAVDCMKQGAVDYLRKPFTAERIKEIVKELINKENVALDKNKDC
jgi:two-component system, OmpR family, response regulator